MLRQGFPHCAKFPTAATRRCLDRVAVPVWLIVLSDQLPVFGLVSHYLTNYLMGRRLHFKRPKPLELPPHMELPNLSASYAILKENSYALLSRLPLVAWEQAPIVTVRLACVKHAASVYPEPGSNSLDKKLISWLITYLYT